MCCLGGEIMLSFIIFESDKHMQDLYSKIIRKYLYTTKDYYDIYIFKEFNCITMSELSKIDGKKIYIINMNLKGIKNGFELGRLIRINGDFDASIIFTYPKGKRISVRNVKNVMPLNVIENNSKLISELYDSIEMAYLIATKNNVLTFIAFDEIYRIPYDDIEYIEKCEDLITIYTKTDTFVHYMSLKKMMKSLECDPRFFKCGRSLIVNLNNIESFHCKDSIIIFKSGASTDMVSKDRKAEFVNRLRKEKTFE